MRCLVRFRNLLFIFGIWTLAPQSFASSAVLRPPRFVRRASSAALRPPRSVRRDLRASPPRAAYPYPPTPWAGRGGRPYPDPIRWDLPPRASTEPALGLSEAVSSTPAVRSLATSSIRPQGLQEQHEAISAPSQARLACPGGAPLSMAPSLAPAAGAAPAESDGAATSGRLGAPPRMAAYVTAPAASPQPRALGRPASASCLPNSKSRQRLKSAGGGGRSGRPGSVASDARLPRSDPTAPGLGDGGGRLMPERRVVSLARAMHAAGQLFHAAPAHIRHALMRELQAIASP